jgi:parvulin-like peptidyl-prolyl isomerase
LVAQQYSFAPSASTGGDMGWITLGELKTEVAAAVEQMGPGTVSDPIVVPGGVMIVSVREKREPSPPKATLKLKEIRSFSAWIWLNFIQEQLHNCLLLKLVHLWCCLIISLIFRALIV